MVQGQSRIEERIDEGREVIGRIMSAKRLSFQHLTPTRLPDEPGLYVITHGETGEVLRVGRTEGQTLRDRVYRNHLMGNQQGNLRAQLVKSGICKGMEEAKQWIRKNCQVRCLEKDEVEIDMNWAEHFLLAVLRPKFSD